MEFLSEIFLQTLTNLNFISVGRLIFSEKFADFPREIKIWTDDSRLEEFTVFVTIALVIQRAVPFGCKVAHVEAGRPATTRHRRAARDAHTACGTGTGKEKCRAIRTSCRPA